MKTIYLLKDLARAAGYSVYTLEYYLKAGLIREFGRGPDTRYRYFDQKAVRRLEWIRKMRKMGMSIKQIRGKIASAKSQTRQADEQ